MVDGFVSNTLAASANQLYFESDGIAVRTGRVYYRVQAGDTFAYRFAFRNTIDSTYADGVISHHDLSLPPWEILRAAVTQCKAVLPQEPLTMTSLTFGGNSGKSVAPDEHFTTDPVTLTCEKGAYLCLEITYRGTRLPYHEESILPIFNKTDNGWVADKQMPLPYLVGCDRAVSHSIAFLGDSITQGIGTTPNAYTHWNARLADRLGDRFAYHNLGIGFGRASDAAANGVWFQKALQSDTVFVCFGVNDILQGACAAAVKRDLTTIVSSLKAAGKHVVLQTVPPFDYAKEKRKIWHEVNDYIRKELCDAVDYLFDSVPILGEDIPYEHRARYGGHPNDEGCAVWADALYEAVRDRF